MSYLTFKAFLPKSTKFVWSHAINRKAILSILLASYAVRPNITLVSEDDSVPITCAKTNKLHHLYTVYRVPKVILLYIAVLTLFAVGPYVQCMFIKIMVNGEQQKVF